jgi:hypothetical protein
MLAYSIAAALAEGVVIGSFSPPADKGRAFIQGTPVIFRHKIESDGDEFLDINRHELTLTKGKSITLKAGLKPSGKSVAVTWKSSNPKIARVSASGKVTAVAPGTAVIRIESNVYGYMGDLTGYSGECYVTVKGGAKDAKPLNTSDRSYSYGTKKFTAPIDNYSDALAAVENSIGGNAYSEDIDYGYYHGLIYGSKDGSKAHTFIYIYSFDEGDHGYGFIAKGDSPIKTNRGIAIGAKNGAVRQKYGIPTYSGQYSEGGKSYEYISYFSKTEGKRLYTSVSFHVLKSSDTVSMIALFVWDY